MTDGQLLVDFQARAVGATNGKKYGPSDFLEWVDG